MKCPTCFEGLVPLPFRGLDLDACPRGDWVWLGRGLLARLHAAIEPKFTRKDLGALREECRARETAAAAETGPSLRCPECERATDRRPLSRVSGIPAHLCKEHGFLVTRGGFEQFVDFLARGGETLARERLRPKLAKLRADAEAARMANSKPSLLDLLFP